MRTSTQESQLILEAGDGGRDYIPERPSSEFVMAAKLKHACRRDVATED